MIITELMGRPHVFTQKDGKTLRVLAHSVNKIADSCISDELKIAETMGLILLTKEEAPKNKKSGGTKNG